MVYRPGIDKHLGFVLMPFHSDFDDVYVVIRKALIAEKLRPLRSDVIYKNSLIIRDIWDSIWKARLVIADVTSRNPNVNYELGMCHTLNVPTIIITQNHDDVPFDYKQRRYVPYNKID